jgi:ferredoxin
LSSETQFIRIDYGKCTKPEECMDCLKTCPSGVFLMGPVGSGKPNIPPKSYKIHPRYADQCNGCGLCEEKCPKQAIQIKLE